MEMDVCHSRFLVERRFKGLDAQVVGVVRFIWYSAEEQ